VNCRTVAVSHKFFPLLLLAAKVGGCQLPYRPESPILQSRPKVERWHYGSPADGS